MFHPKDFWKFRFVTYLQIGIQILNKEQVLRVEGPVPMHVSNIS